MCASINLGCTIDNGTNTMLEIYRLTSWKKSLDGKISEEMLTTLTLVYAPFLEIYLVSFNISFQNKLKITFFSPLFHCSASFPMVLELSLSYSGRATAAYPVYKSQGWL